MIHRVSHPAQCDLETRDHISDSDIAKWCDANEVHGVFRCSAKNNTGLKDCVEALVTLMQKSERPPMEPVNNRPDIAAEKESHARRCAC